MSYPPSNDPILLPRLRADLSAARYTVAGVRDLLGEVAFDATHREEVFPAHLAVTAVLANPRSSAAERALAALAGVFFIGDEVPAIDLAAALPTLTLAGARTLGLIVGAAPGRASASDDLPDDAALAPGAPEHSGNPGALVRARIDLRPYSADDAAGHVDWWLASDLGELATGRSLEGNHVLGVGGASLTLAQVTTRANVGRVLDLGTGSGIQALHASRHSDTVVATDISESALKFAGFNAALNGVDLELRLGSMLEPVAGEEFDLVVSNPPFVITPDAARGGDAPPSFEYRDGGKSGDDLVRDLICGVGQVLAPGGKAHLLGNWEHRSGQDWTERVGAWLDESGLDGWVIQREVLDPAQYAETWLRDGGTTPERDQVAYRTAYAAWLDDFAGRDVESIGLGIVTLRRPRDGQVTLRRLEEHTGSVHQPLGGHLGASIAAHDWLAQRSDAGLLAEHLTVAPDVTEERYFTPGSSDPNVVIIRQGGGLGRAVHSSTALAALTGASDGELSVGAILDAIASIFEVDSAELVAEVLPGVRGLVRDGFLLPG